MLPTAGPLSQPLCFQPLFMERIWGGRRLETLYGKPLPPHVQIGESWEVVDRPEAQSVVAEGPWRGRTLHDLWTAERDSVFGDVADAPRFPLLIKLLDAREKLSLQVHPPADVAAGLGGEPKTEFWYIADAGPAADLFVGLKKRSGRAELEQALENGRAEEHVHRVPVRAGDAMFLPSGRMHAIGAGNVIVEIQQNSDTTYRVFDWNRLDAEGNPRQLHLAESMRAIDFDDHEPELVTPAGESLLRDPLFNIDKWTLDEPREAAAPGSFAILACLTGELTCAGSRLRPGGFLLLPASLANRRIEPAAAETSLLRVTIGSQARG
jgi:mannose-6-phosphate isomerase